jgi:amylosucrase
MWTEEKILDKIRMEIVLPSVKKGLDSGFDRRLSENFSDLWKNFSELYSNRFDCLYQLEDLVSMMIGESRKYNFSKEEEYKNWFRNENPVAMMLYVDLFNGNLKGIEDKLDYFTDLGINVIHLMPLFESPSKENDGGYAVSDYRKVREELGTMEQLKSLAEKMEEKEMHLIVDFVLNHTSDEHEWARSAIKGSEKYSNYYFAFETKKEADRYNRTLRDIFPTIRKGSFTYHEKWKKWVWTTFNSYQWDLNYSNPEVFTNMCAQMLFLAGCGVHVLRLDALAFTWKELGSSCENLPKTHSLIRLFRTVAAITVPHLTFLSEAIVHPDEVVKYISPDECELSYNPLQMATSWEALATRNTSLLKKTFSPRFKIHESCTWVNYLRCHDDMGWTFCDNDAADLNIDAHGHRKFLNDFYTGRFSGSFASGVPFQENPENGDARISGTMASLAGLEKALVLKDPRELELALKRIELINGFLLSLPGIPLIYSGDELAVINDYSYLDREEKKEDSRWVHRSPFPWNMLKLKESEPQKRIWKYMKKMIALRKSLSFFRGTMDIMSLESANLLGFRLSEGQSHLLVILNFTERKTELDFNTLRLYGGAYSFRDILSNRIVDSDLTVSSYELLWLKEGASCD